MSLTSTILSLPLACALWAAAVPAQAVDLAQLPGEERWLVQVDVATVMKGRLGQWLLQHQDGMVKARLSLLTAVTGLDLTKDLDSLTLCGADAGEDSALIYAHGRFDGKRLTTLVQAAEGYTSIPYQGHAIAQWNDTKRGAGKLNAACLVGDGLLVFSPRPELVQLALDVLDGRSQDTAAKSGQFDAAAFPAGAPLVLAATVDMQNWAKLAPQAAMLRNVRGVVAGIAELGDDFVVSAHLGGRDAAAAAQLRDLAQGLIALAKLNQGAPMEPVVQAVVDSAQISASGADLSASAHVPIAAVLSVIEKRNAGQAP